MPWDFVDAINAIVAINTLIDEAPAVDAIPVEWLCQKAREEGERENILHAEYIKDLIWKWHQEQEVQDGAI